MGDRRTEFLGTVGRERQRMDEAGTDGFGGSGGNEQPGGQSEHARGSVEAPRGLTLLYARRWTCSAYRLTLHFFLTPEDSRGHWHRGNRLARSPRRGVFQAVGVGSRCSKQ